jgi:hypothetical protein
MERVKRRTLKTDYAEKHLQHHHNVYVVLLEPAIGDLPRIRALNPNRDALRPCVYVGMTGLTP